ncbi:hypothetical protein TEQG_02940 [Trichophyton equinum CBS 127.97]|uniref:Uncharacterized protein n=1 Tax=Trichophyton equinum (strain ATCC MYA-4606 / CBS 127.97) TaxID=559882 RepID=F2PPT9_TRIEC|nr:hypothetical protein TEQG_02940 [Trichophyton equinum CBS 127.97]
MEAAIEDLKSQEVPNFSETIKRHGVYRITLIRRFRDRTWIPPTLIYKGEGDLQDT